MAIFGPNPRVNPFEKMSIFRLFELLVFILKKGVCSFLNIVKNISWPILLKRKKIGKMDGSSPKPWVNPFRKKAIFRLFQLLVLIA